MAGVLLQASRVLASKGLHRVGGRGHHMHVCTSKPCGHPSPLSTPVKIKSQHQWLGWSITLIYPASQEGWLAPAEHPTNTANTAPGPRASMCRASIEYHSTVQTVMHELRGTLGAQNCIVLFRHGLCLFTVAVNLAANPVFICSSLIFRVRK